MIAGVIGFLFASLLVAGFGPKDGQLVSGSAFLPLVYIFVFDLMHRRSTNLRLKQRHAGSLGPSTGQNDPSPWSLVLLHLAGFLAILHFGWSRFVQDDLKLGQYFLAPALLMILPWFAVYISSLYHRWRLDEAERRDPWPLGKFLRFQLRIFIIPLLPCLVFSSINWLRDHDSFRFVLAAYPSLELVISLIFTLIMVVLSPFLIRAAVASVPMPQSALRDRFESIANQGGFRFLDIRVVDTHNRIVNAMFVGVAGRLRYVFMTDAILERLNEEDLAGVFAHEMGHSRRGHILLNMAMFLGLSLFLHISIDGQQVDSSSMAAFFLYPFFIFFVFSPVAKAFESEADAFAGEVLGDPGPIRRSLESLGRMYPKRMTDGGLVHPSIEQRVGFLGLYFKEPTMAAMFRHRLRRIKWTIAFFFFVPLLLWIGTLPMEFQTGALRAGAMEASVAEDGDRAAALLQDFENKHEGHMEDPGYAIQATLWQTVAIAAQKREDFAAAEPMIKRMRIHRDDFDLPALVYNTSILSAQQAAGVGDWPRLIRERRRAAEELEVIAEMAPSNAQLIQEREDLVLLEAIEIAARRLGLLPPSAHPQLLPQPGTPELVFLHRLVGTKKDPSTAAKQPLAGDLDEDKLTPGWKRASLRILKMATGSKQDH